MDIQLFDNYEEDGQLSMFDLGEDLEEIQMRTTKPQSGQSSHTNIRIQKCSTCGKLLMVKQEEAGYASYCNACEIHYWQKL